MRRCGDANLWFVNPTIASAEASWWTMTCWEGPRLFNVFFFSNISAKLLMLYHWRRPAPEKSRFSVASLRSGFFFVHLLRPTYHLVLRVSGRRISILGPWIDRRTLNLNHSRPTSLPPNQECSPLGFWSLRMILISSYQERGVFVFEIWDLHRANSTKSRHNNTLSGNIYPSTSPRVSQITSSAVRTVCVSRFHPKQEISLTCFWNPVLSVGLFHTKEPGITELSLLDLYDFNSSD